MNAFPTPRLLKIMAISLGVVVAFYLLREHWGHALGVLPYLLLLACPLLHLFHGHGGHGGHKHGEPGNGGQGGNAERPGPNKT